MMVMTKKFLTLGKFYLKEENCCKENTSIGISTFLNLKMHPIQKNVIYENSFPLTNVTVENSSDSSADLRNIPMDLCPLTPEREDHAESDAHLTTVSTDPPITAKEGYVISLDCSNFQRPFSWMPIPSNSSAHLIVPPYPPPLPLFPPQPPPPPPPSPPTSPLQLSELKSFQNENCNNLKSKMKLESRIMEVKSKIPDRKLSHLEYAIIDNLFKVSMCDQNITENEGSSKKSMKVDSKTVADNRREKQNENNTSCIRHCKDDSVKKPKNERNASDNDVTSSSQRTKRGYDKCTDELNVVPRKKAAADIVKSENVGTDCCLKGNSNLLDSSTNTDLKITNHEIKSYAQSIAKRLQIQSCLNLSVPGNNCNTEVKQPNFNKMKNILVLNIFDLAEQVEISSSNAIQQISDFESHDIKRKQLTFPKVSLDQNISSKIVDKQSKDINICSSKTVLKNNDGIKSETVQLSGSESDGYVTAFSNSPSPTFRNYTNPTGFSEVETEKVSISEEYVCLPIERSKNNIGKVFTKVSISETFVNLPIQKPSENSIPQNFNGINNVVDSCTLAQLTVKQEPEYNVEIDCMRLHESKVENFLAQSHRNKKEIITNKDLCINEDSTSSHPSSIHEEDCQNVQELVLVAPIDIRLLQCPIVRLERNYLIESCVEKCNADKVTSGK